MNEKYTIKIPNLVNTIGAYPGLLVEVLPSSKVRVKKTLEEFARYFKREGYSDFVHYDPAEKEDASTMRAFLFTGENASYSTPIGGCCFRLRKYKGLPPFWTMHWVWIHPYFRNKGVLTKRKKYFDKMFEYWHPEPPLSKSIEAFIKKNNIIEPTKALNFSKNEDT